LKGRTLVKAAFSQYLELATLREANYRISNELTRVTDISTKSNKSSSHAHSKRERGAEKLLKLLY
jgi:hypothetical protein